MAGDWIKMRNDLYDDPRVIRISSLTCPEHVRELAHRYSIVGRLYALWVMADKHTTDGILPGLMPKNLDETLEMPGFSSALVEVGWLEILTEGLTQGLAIPRFWEHNGDSSKARMLKNQRQSRWRGGVVGATAPTAAPTAAPTREEKIKRREEKDPYGKEDCSEMGCAPISEPPARREGSISFPCVGRGAHEWVFTVEQIASYQRDYPGINVREEALKARRWCENNPKRRKTASGMPRFLANWLNKAQDSVKIPVGRKGSEQNVDLSATARFMQKEVSHDAT
jgi:hypothetical protein